MYADKKYDSDPGTGHRITGVKQALDIWMFLQNPNGVMGKDTWLDNKRALLFLRKWGVDILSLPETNCNWTKEWLRNKWMGKAYRVWQHAKVFFTSIDQPASKYDNFVQGGACLIITGRWASRVMAHGSDSLGRWVWATLWGKQQERLTVVSLYCPNPGGDDSGPTTVWAQQLARMQ